MPIVAVVDYEAAKCVILKISGRENNCKNRSKRY